MTRRDANLQILNVLHSYIEHNPDIRFGQALRNVGIVVDKWNVERQENEWLNGFNEEPQFVLMRIRKQKGPSNDVA